jgi:cytochrome c oxidase subunit II
MRVHVYEKAFLWVGAGLLVLCGGTLAYTTLSMGIHLPGAEQQVDPATIRTLPPFDNPGVRHVGDHQYQAVIIGQAWQFLPAEIHVPAGAEVTFIATSVDVIHGFEIAGTRLNMMLIPGQVSKNTYTFKEPGEHLMICHEYCGAGHQFMFGKVIVE